MTNFEKWRDFLKPEDMVHSDGGRLWADWDADGKLCRKCPAKQFCEDCWKVRAMTEEGCGFRFLKWANMEAKKEASK